MELFGRQVKFLRTVQAACDLSELCPDKDLRKIGEIFKGTYTEMLPGSIKFVQALNNGYEDSEAFWNEGYERNPELTEEQLKMLPDDTFQLLLMEAISAYFGDKPTVEVEPQKDKKKEK